MRDKNDNYDENDNDGDDKKDDDSGELVSGLYATNERSEVFRCASISYFQVESE